jgi:hypothetical protein
METTHPLLLSQRTPQIEAAHKKKGKKRKEKPVSPKSRGNPIHQIPQPHASVMVQ